MEKLIQLNETMSSREIATLTGKLHKHILESIRSQEVAWTEVTGTKFRLSDYTDSTGRKLPQYQLTKTESLYIATKFNDEARAKVILRWEELEKQNLQLPQSFSEALMLAARQAEQLELQSAELKKQAPKVEYYEEVLQSQSTYVTNQIAKELGTSAITLNRKLQSKRIIYRQNGTYLLYQRYQNKGYTKTKTHTYTDSNGNQKTAMQLVWTEKGRQFIHQLFQS